MAVDWLKIKNDYISGGGSYRELAEKYGVLETTLEKKAAKEKWRNLKMTQRVKIEEKLLEKNAEKISDNESEIAAIKSRLKLNIYQQLEARMSAEGVDGMEFRRQVQSYIDMCNMKSANSFESVEDLTTLAEMLKL